MPRNPWLRLGGRKRVPVVLMVGGGPKSLETGRCVLHVTPGCVVDITSELLDVMLWLLARAGRSPGSGELFTELLTINSIKHYTRVQADWDFRPAPLTGVIERWGLRVQLCVKGLFLVAVSRWEREGWRPPRPPLHPGQRTHMITWLWTWMRSCQTLFGPRGQNRVWQETCWKVRDQCCPAPPRSKAKLLCKMYSVSCF